MNLGEYARKHCSNWLTTYCHIQWARNAKDKDVFAGTDKIDGTCLVAQGQPCHYFLKAVIPAKN